MKFPDRIEQWQVTLVLLLCTHLVIFRLADICSVTLLGHIGLYDAFVQWSVQTGDLIMNRPD